MIQSLFRFFVAMMSSLILVTGTAKAEVVTKTIKTLGLQAQAKFYQGSPNKPAVLILHGFLTTNKFHTVNTMAKALQDIGVTTLAPTLTLGISQRKQSIKCNAIHTHRLQDDMQEVDEWVQWLKAKGYSNIILLGHSSGSLELLEYQKVYADPAIKAVIFTSLFYLNGRELGISQDDLTDAQEAKVTDQKKPRKYTFLFCKGDYFAIPESYLSYMVFTRDYVLDSIKALKIPVYTIMGGADKRYQSVGENWLDDLKATGTDLAVIDGANHFFSSEYEFDLQDHITEIVSEIADKY